MRLEEGTLELPAAKIQASSLPAASACGCGNTERSSPRRACGEKDRMRGPCRCLSHRDDHVFYIACQPRNDFAGPGPEFHFGGKSHQGALLVSPGGIYDWSAASADLDEQSLLAFLDARNGSASGFLLIGTGPKVPSFAARVGGTRRAARAWPGGDGHGSRLQDLQYSSGREPPVRGSLVTAMSEVQPADGEATELENEAAAGLVKSRDRERYWSTFFAAADNAAGALGTLRLQRRA